MLVEVMVTRCDVAKNHRKNCGEEKDEETSLWMHRNRQRAVAADVLGRSHFKVEQNHKEHQHERVEQRPFTKRVQVL